MSVFVCPGVGIGTSCKKRNKKKTITVVSLAEGVGRVVGDGGMVTAGIEPRISMLFSDKQLSRHVLPLSCNN